MISIQRLGSAVPHCHRTAHGWRCLRRAEGSQDDRHSETGSNSHHMARVTVEQRPEGRETFGKTLLQRSRWSKSPGPVPHVRETGQKTCKTPLDTAHSFKDDTEAIA